MKPQRLMAASIALAFLAAVISVLVAATANAHCDTMNGPIIPEAKAALQKAEVFPILKWVRKADEPELKNAFQMALAVRGEGKDAKELADRYFLETLIRLHRAGEGAPYTGLKDEPVEPIVSMADDALASGSADEMINKITAHMEEAIRAKFNKALAAKKNKDGSVEAGREYVEAYVTYMHYVEGIHTAITSTGTHAHDHTAQEAAPSRAEHGEHRE